MSRVNMQIHSLTLDALNVKQKYPGTQVALRNASDTRLSLRRREQVFTRLSKSYKENMIFQAEAPAMKKWLFCWMRKDAGSVDATWRISSSSLRMCARQDCFVFERPQVVFYCNFTAPDVSKSANLIGRIVFDATKKMNQRRVFFLNDAFTWGVFRVGVHTHIGALCLVTRR